MGQRILYQMSARQIILLALGSALIAVGAFVGLSIFGNVFKANELSLIVGAEEPTSTIANSVELNDEQNSIEVYRKMSPGVAYITTSSITENWWGERREKESGNGSGSLIDRKGHILTNNHVIEGASRLNVSFGGDKIYPARVVGTDPDTDLAVIKITPPAQGLTVIPLGDSDKLDVGQKVLAIGNPFGLDRTLTTGVISGLQRPIRARNGRPIDAAIQTDASINPGNSGGPLLDKFGRMIGINSQILSPSRGSVGVGFAVPVNTAKRVIPQLIKFGKVNRPKLNAAFVSVDRLSKRGYQLPVEKGLLVERTFRGGSLEAAGVRGLTRDGNDMLLGDIILSGEGTEINSVDDLYRFLDKKKIGDTVNLKLFRGGQQIVVPVKLLPVADSRLRRTRRY